MSSRTFCAVAVVVLAAALGLGVVEALGRLPSVLAVAVVGVGLCWLCFSLWPWAVLPTSIIGGTMASVLIGDGEIRTDVIAHALPLVAGSVALVTRWVLLRGQERFHLPRHGAMMALLLVLTVLAATYGLAAGNEPKHVTVAAYQIGVIPVYFLLAMGTLDTARRRRDAAILYVGTIATLTAFELATPGRHGGLLTLLAVPPLLLLAGQAHGWRRAGLAVLTAVLGADVVLASYRGVWLAAGVAVAIVAIRGGSAVRRGLVATAGAAVVLVALISLDAGVRDRSAVISVSLERSAGYRLPESLIGLDVFAARPIFGAGLGQTTAHIYVPGFAVTDVGPTYHAFYVLILANLGLVGLAALLWPMLRTIWSGLAEQGGLAMTFAALTCGFLAAALVVSPSDGHWELGLLPALTLLTLRAPSARRPSPAALPAVGPAQTVAAGAVVVAGHGSPRFARPAEPARRTLEVVR